MVLWHPRLDIDESNRFADVRCMLMGKYSLPADKLLSSVTMFS